MFVIFETGGKQYRAQEGDKVKVEMLPGDAGAIIEFRKVLFASGPQGVITGSPYLENALVSAKILGEVKGPKLLIFKKKRRKQYQRLRGHRQHYTEVRIEKIAI